MAGPGETDQELVLDLSREVLAVAAPEELVLLEETSREYFADPAAALQPDRRDEPIGFGVELELLTPYVLAVVTPVINFLLAIAVDAVRTEARPAIVAWVRRVLRRPALPGAPSTGAATAALTPEQARTVRRIAYERARDLGVEEGTANVLADAVAGGVVVAE